MHVQVKILPWFSGLFVPGKRTSLLLDEELPSGSTLGTLLNVLADRYYPKFEEIIYNPHDGTLQAAVILTHNGRLVSPAIAPDLVLESGDSIAFIPVYSGG